MKIASFNSQKFGKKKVSDPEVLDIMTKIVSRYDIILILEVVDASGESIKTFMAALKKANKEYTFKISDRLGSGRYKEKFMFIYRENLFTSVTFYQFDDEATKGKDVINRDPYILKLTCSNTVLKDLVMIPVHTKPEDSAKELDELYDVVMIVKEKWRTDNIMILGDFNADGSYISNRDMKKIRIRKDKKFHWLIRDGLDTTTSTKNTNTYDRIVIYGDDMLNAVVSKSAKAFNFQEEFKLCEEKARKVSDHYPVEVELSIVKTDETNARPAENKLIAASKPKGKTSSYAFFVSTFREEHKKDHPGTIVEFTEFSKMCSERWKTMSPEEKAKFEEMAKNDKLRYDREMKSYVPPEGSEKGKKKKKKKKKDPNAPKKPPSAFFIFSSFHREKIKKDNPGISIPEISKMLGEMWAKRTTPTPYEAKYAELMKKYKKDVAAYRAKGGSGKSPAEKKSGSSRPTAQKAEPADDDEDEDNEDKDDDDEDDD